MCVAIFLPEDKTLTKETLQACFEANPDGCGFAYIKKKEIKIFKSMEFDPFYAEFEKVHTEFGKKSPFLIHFRIKTHGTKDIFNCHPFRIDDNMVFIHNGIITRIADDPEKKKSDTQMFNEIIFQNLPKGWFYNDAIDILIEDFIGGSKLVVLNLNGEYKIYNEEKGNWQDDIWFSNLYWKSKLNKHKNNKCNNDKDDDSWRRRWNTNSNNIYTRSERCLQCRNWITNNPYAISRNVSFCSATCEDIWYERILPPKRDTTIAPESACMYCGERPVTLTVWHKNIPYRYCSRYCEVQDEKRRHGEDDIKLIGFNQQDKTVSDENEKEENKVNYDEIPCYTQCCWCGDWKEESELIIFDENQWSYCLSDSTVYMCIDCIDEAIASGIIRNTEELQNILEEYQNNKFEKNEKLEAAEVQ